VSAAVRSVPIAELAAESRGCAELAWDGFINVATEAGVAVSTVAARISRWRCQASERSATGAACSLTSAARRCP
jgi:hypothetical protein